MNHRGICRTLLSCARKFALWSALFPFLSIAAIAQMDSATLTGRVANPSGVSIAKARVELVDVERNTTMTTHTNNSGLYVFSDVRPGRYRMHVSAPGFRTVSLTSITVYTQDDVAQNFSLAPGSPGSSIILGSSAVPVETTGTVATVVEQELVSELPLNGRSFQTLLLLTPGVVIAPTSFASQGQFSVNGQRTDTNNFIVDGVSANFAIAGGVSPGQTAAGLLPALSVFGSTNTLASTDDVQEFAVLTSSYSAEFGRMPGAQVSIVTRSGTSKFAGTVFEYLRNDAFDANDWFANKEGLRRAALRQSDYGGVLEGPIAKDRTFFFASFERLELRQPTSRVIDVPSLVVRNSAPGAVQPFLEAYPLPNGPETAGGVARSTYGFSNPSSLGTFGLRIDHHYRESLTTFARYLFSVSDGQQRGVNGNSLSTVTDTHSNLKTVTAGLAYTITPQVDNNFRFNWSDTSASSADQLDNFGGAVPILRQLVFPPGFNERDSLFQFVALTPQDLELSLGRNVDNTQSQINLVNDVAYKVRGHLIKVGLDFRNLSPTIRPALYTQQVAFTDVQSAVRGTTSFTALGADTKAHAVFKSYSGYAQDTWRPYARLSAAFGIRWEYGPAPAVRGTNGLQPFAVTGFNDLPRLALAPAGTPLYHASPNNFGPRLGLAYELRQSSRTESVLRCGFGIYYDIGNGASGNTISGISFPFSAQKLLFGATFPLNPSDASPPSITTNPPFSLIETFPSVLKTPYVYHWNLSLDQAIGTSQTINIGYIGAAGHSLLRTEEYIGGKAGVPASFTQLLLTNNGGYSNYHSLQLKFQRRAASIHVLVSYTLAHSLDNISTDAVFNGIPARFIKPRQDYGPSDFDIRHTATAGADYELPHGGNRFASMLLANWYIDPILLMRSAPPVDVEVSRDIGFGTYDFHPDLTPDVPLYLPDPSAPGGRRINLPALSLPVAPRQGDLGRNAFRAFALFQIDLALRRSFRISDRVGFEARVEAFNLFNHPNFAPPAGQLGSIEPGGNFVPQPGFGVSGSTLAQGLQSGSFGSGFSPLYQIGGARSLQLAMKVHF